MFRLAAIAALSLASMSVGCAHAPEPLRLRYADLTTDPKTATLHLPLILEVRQGDRLPVDLRFEGELFRMEPSAPPIEIVATRACFVRIDENGIRTSLDGVSFDAKPKVPGHFQLGINMTPAGAKLLVSVTAPKMASP